MLCNRVFHGLSVTHCLADLLRIQKKAVFLAVQLSSLNKAVSLCILEELTVSWLLYLSCIWADNIYIYIYIRICGRKKAIEMKSLVKLLEIAFHLPE